MLTLLSFLTALALLIAVHELGHYGMARACGVKVLRFSIGFGPRVLRWQARDTDTEFVLCLLPLGGYVRMLDEHEGAVSAADLAQAFNRQPLRSRALIVMAGPVANLCLAVFLYAALSWVGVQQAAPVLSSPVPTSLAEAAGLQGGERVRQLIDGSGVTHEVLSFEDLRWRLTQSALQGEDATLVWTLDGSAQHRTWLPLASLNAREPDDALFQRLGLVAPLAAPVVTSVLEGSAAQRAGLLAGDRVLSVDGQPVPDSQALRERIRNAASPPEAMTWLVERSLQALTIHVRPEVQMEAGVPVGRIGVYLGAPVEMTTVRHGGLGGLMRGVQHTWEMSVLSLRMMGRVMVGQASVKNISGPLTMADYAGKSASMGVLAYVSFLALISVSLGVLNLLPVPVLDGGHLMYYLWEWLTGRPVTQVWLDRFQRVGLALLAMMMVTAVFNDLTRLLG